MTGILAYMKSARVVSPIWVWLPICCKIQRLIYIDATGVILACFYSTGVIFVYLYSTKLLFLCNEMINFYSTKIAMILYGIAIPVLKVSINYEIVSKLKKIRT